MAHKSYGQFCPVAKGAEVFNEKWTPLIIREMLCGNHRFSELRKGNPLMSPTILSQRLKSLEEAGVIAREMGEGDATTYHLTPAGEDLGRVVVQLGLWGDKWARSRLEEDDYDPNLLMWDVRRRIRTDHLPRDKRVINFQFMDMPVKKRAWWLVIENREVDLCLKNPGFDVDLVFRTTAKTMALIWQKHIDWREQVRDGNLVLHGDQDMQATLDDWLGFSIFTTPEQLPS